MSKKVLILTAILLVFSACELQAAAINSNWIGGSRGDWETASNWNPAIVPENGADTFYVTINGGADGVWVGLWQENHTISQLDCNGTVELANSEWGLSTLTVLNGITNHGNFEIENLYIDANIVNTNGATIIFDEEHAHEDQFKGNLTNNVGGTIKVEDSLNFEHDGILDNAGTINLNVAGKLYGGAVSELFNRGTLNLRGGICTSFRFLNDVNGIITGPGTIVVGDKVNDKFENTGTIYPNGALACISVTDVNNQGNIEITTASSVTFFGNLINKSGATIRIQGGNLAAPTIKQSTGAIFEGFGGIAGDILIDPNGIIKLTGPTNIVGDVTVEHNAVLEISDGQTLITGHTTNNGEILVVNGKVVFQGGYSGSGIVQKD